MDSSITKEEQSMMMDVDPPNFSKAVGEAPRVTVGEAPRVVADGGAGKDSGT